MYLVNYMIYFMSLCVANVHNIVYVERIEVNMSVLSVSSSVYCVPEKNDMELIDLYLYRNVGPGGDSQVYNIIWWHIRIFAYYLPQLKSVNIYSKTYLIKRPYTVGESCFGTNAPARPE